MSQRRALGFVVALVSGVSFAVGVLMAMRFRVLDPFQIVLGLIAAHGWRKVYWRASRTRPPRAPSAQGIAVARVATAAISRLRRGGDSVCCEGVNPLNLGSPGQLHNLVGTDMRRTAGRLRSLLLFAGLAVAGSGCWTVPDPEFAALESALTLSIVGAKRSASGGSGDFSFELTNRGSRSAKACLGPSRSVSYKVASSGGTSSTFVDHPGCTREFTIQPGGVMSWDETLEVPRLSQGHVEVEVSVQIVNPRRCGSWGNCAAIYLKSNPFEIP
jgi:hypothetical protein